MGNARRSALFAIGERYGAMVITIVSSMILARILTPGEIGIFSVGIAAAGLFQTFRDFGVSNYLIQVRDISLDTIRSALTISALISLSLGAVLVLSAPLLAEFYGEPGVRLVIYVLAINFLLVPISSTLMAIMKRDMWFGAIAKIGLLSALASAITSIALAWSGLGFISLAYGAVAGTATSVLGVIRMAGNRHYYHPSLRSAGHIVRFGGAATTAALIGEVTVRAPDFTLARTISFDAVGLYGKAVSTVTLFTSTILDGLGSVLTPAIAKEVRAGNEISAFFLKAISYFTVIAWPVYATLWFLAEPFLMALFGPQWTSAAMVVSLLAVTASLQICTFGVEHTFIATGKLGRLIAVRLSLLLPTYGAFVLLAPQGLEAIAGATIGIMAGYGLISYRLAYDTLRVGLLDLIGATWRSSVVALAFLPVSYLFMTFWNGSEPSAWLIVCLYAITASMLWLLLIFMTAHPIADEVRSAFRLVHAKLR